MTKNPRLIIAAAILGIAGVVALLVASQTAGRKGNPFLGAAEVERVARESAAAAMPWTIGGWVALGLAVVAVLLYLAAKPEGSAS